MAKIILSIMMSLFILAQSAVASSGSSLARVEKLFLDGRYNTVISEADGLINSGEGRKDELYYLKGLSELKSNKFAGARESFSCIIDHYSWSEKIFDARIGMGDSYLLEGNNSKALSVYSDIASQYSTDKNIPIVYGRLNLCYSKMGLRDKADSYLKMVRDQAPYSFEAKLASPSTIDTKKFAEKETSSPNANEGKYSLQVGSFKNKRNAEKLVRKLTAKGYKSYISIPVLSSDKFYRVKVGNFSSQAEASNIASKLKSEGYGAKSCTDDVCE